MSNPSALKENDVERYDDSTPWQVRVIFGSMFILLGLVAGGGIPLAAELGSRRMAEQRALRAQEWRLAHKDVVECDFGNGIRFSVKSQKPADVPESTRPLLAEGLAAGACRLAYPQNAQS